MIVNDKPFLDKEISSMKLHYYAYVEGNKSAMVRLGMDKQKKKGPWIRRPSPSTERQRTEVILRQIIWSEAAISLDSMSKRIQKKRMNIFERVLSVEIPMLAAC